METEQAHSRAGAGSDEAPVASRVAPLLWLNLVCLDAPIVAVLWLWLFARTFQAPLHLGNAVALFLTAWLIYVADRLADVSSLKVGSPRSLRQEFCLRHREIWISALLLIGGFDLYVIWRSVDAGTFFAGGIVGVLALIYLVLNHPLGRIWRSLPAKELAIGLLFTAGTLVALLPSLQSVTISFAASALAFAALCALNCISIACWEHQLDQAQGRVSVATRHPGLARYVGKTCALLALGSFAIAIAYRPGAPVLGCVSASALLLAWLNMLPRQVNDDQPIALADLVLLTPIVALVTIAS